MAAHIADHPVNRFEEFLPWHRSGRLAPAWKHAASQRCCRDHYATRRATQDGAEPTLVDKLDLSSKVAVKSVVIWVIFIDFKLPHNHTLGSFDNIHCATVVDSPTFIYFYPSI